jgi:hypothetical protein
MKELIAAVLPTLILVAERFINDRRRRRPRRSCRRRR